MLRDHRTITSVVTSDLCMSCGICQPSCHVDAISIINDPKKGMFIPVIDEDVCDLCDDAKVGRCVVVCPGVEVKFDVLTKKFLDNSKYLNLLGNYEHTYYAHATDDDIRFNSSSGGLVTSLLLFLLEQKIVDGVAVITMNEGLEPKGIIARTPEEIRAAAGSKYCPSHLGDAISEITRIEGRYAVVGLPCHIHGLRKFEKVLPLLQKRIIYHFGLYCANNNTFHATEYFLGENNINPRDVKQLRYRGNGWPGLFSVTTKNGAEVEIRRGTTETDKNRRAAFSSAFHYDFQLPRCFTCNDLTAELADISFADPWNKKFKGLETIGKSMLVTRNAKGDKLLKLAHEKGIIDLQEAEPEEVSRSQNTDFKMGADSRMKILGIFGKAIPHYSGKKRVVHHTDLIRFPMYIMSFLPKNKFTYGLLPFVQKGRRIAMKVIGLLERIGN